MDTPMTSESTSSTPVYVPLSLAARELLEQAEKRDKERLSRAKTIIATKSLLKTAVLEGRIDGIGLSSKVSVIMTPFKNELIT